MPNVINGTSTGSGGLITTGDDSGILNIQTNETTAITVDASQVVTFAKQPAGTFAGTGPAFSAYAGATTSVTTATFTKVLFNTEEFDTASCFLSSTFTPNVAGYYQINATIIFSGGTTTGVYFITLFKNGAEFKRGNQPGAISNDSLATVGSIIYFNGTTDYLDVYTYQNSGSTKTVGSGSSVTYVNGAMVRSA